MSYVHETGSPVALSTRMRASTARKHKLAERSGIVAAILSGRASRAGYALYLRNLLPVYRRMEEALERLEVLMGITQLARTALYRADRIDADLVALVGPRWSDQVPLLPSGQRYAARVEFAGASEGGKLIAHAYTRYLGDLSGGRILRRSLAQQFGPGFPLAFAEFPAISEVGAFAAAFRAALDSAASHVTDEAAVVHEAIVAFDLNIDLSREVDAVTRGVDANGDIAVM